MKVAGTGHRSMKVSDPLAFRAAAGLALARLIKPKGTHKLRLRELRFWS